MDESTDIGRKLKLFRVQKSLTINEVAEKAEITSSMLSQIERGIVNPSINTLRMISKALNIPIYMFFLDNTDDNYYIVRKNQRKYIGKVKSEASYELLTPDVRGGIEFCMMNIPPKKETVEKPQSHWGEEVSYVLKGTVDLFIEDQKYTLKAGDSARILPLHMHKWVNNYEEEVKVIFAVSPPSF